MHYSNKVDIRVNVRFIFTLSATFSIFSSKANILQKKSKEALIIVKLMLLERNRVYYSTKTKVLK